MDYSRYYKDRENKFALGYRLKRRSLEIIKAIIEYKGNEIDSLLDIGCADGKMLEIINKKIKINSYFGIDKDIDLLNLASNKIREHLKIGSAESLEFKEKIFNVIISTAVIEHLDFPEKFLNEAFRVLKNEGILIITTPHPLFEKIATLCGHLKDETHIQTFNLKKLKLILKKNKFKVLIAKRFMISPIGMPYETPIENFLNKINCQWLMCNQLIVATKL